MSELCPAFIMNGEEIVDVFYVPFEETPRGYAAIGDTKFSVSAVATHVIVEAPTGCYQWSYSFRPGDTLNINHGGGVPLQPCERMSSRTREDVTAQS
jgi:hypothetical protein